MKRNLLAIAIPALLVAGAANASIEVWNKDGNKLNINGRVKAMNYIGNSDNAIDGEGDNTSARLGFTGETQISDLLTGYGRVEWETGHNSEVVGVDGSGNAIYENSTGVTTRYAFAGLGFGEYGSFDYGRNDGVLKAIGSYTDVLPEFGGNTSDYYQLAGREDAVATYRNAGFFGLVDGLNVAVQYADQDSSVGSNDAEAYGLNAEYAILDTGLTVGAGYAQNTDDNKTWAAGVKYDAYNVYLAANYMHEKEDSDKVRGFEVVAQYGIDFNVGHLTPSVAYIQHKEKASGSSKDKVKYVEVGMVYDFNKNIAAVVDYKINLLSTSDAGSKANTKDTVALGLIYQF